MQRPDTAESLGLAKATFHHDVANLHLSLKWELKPG